MPTTERRFLAAFLFLFLLVPGNTAKAETFGDEQNHYIQYLTEGGFPELAYKYCHLLLKKNKQSKSDSDLTKLRVGNLALALATQTTDPNRQNDLLAEADAILTQLLPRAETISQRDISAIDLIRLLVTSGGLAVGRWEFSRNEKDRRKAELSCSKALLYLDTVLDTLEVKAEKMELDMSDNELMASIEYNTLDAWISEGHYRKAWASYFLAVSTRDKETSRQLVDQAQEFFEEFTGTYMNSVVVVNCYIGQAKCLDALDQTDKAAEFLKPIERGKAPEHLLNQANILRANWLLKQKKYLDATLFIEKALRHLTEEDVLGDVELNLFLKQAEAYFMLWKQDNRPGHHEKGVKTAEKVSEFGGSWRSQALNLLAKFQASSLVKDKRSPLEAWVEAERLYARKQYQEAEALYTEVIQQHGQLKDKQILSAAMFRKAACQYLQGQPRRALDGFQEFLKLHPQDKLAPRASYLVAQSQYTIYRSTRAEDDAAKSMAAFEKFSKSYPNSPDTAEATLAYADALSLAGKFNRALEELKKVPSNSEANDGAQAVSLLVRQRKLEESSKGNPGTARTKAEQLAKEMRKFIERNSGISTWAAQVRLTLAEFLLSDALKLPEQAIELVTSIKTHHPDASPRILHQAIRLRMEGYIQTRQWKPAQIELARLLKLPAGDSSNGTALLKAARGMREASVDSYQEGKADKSKVYLLWSAAAYEALLKWLEAHHANRDQVAEARTLLVEIYLYCQQTERALTHLRPMEKANPKSWFVLRNLAVTEERQENYATALEKWRHIEDGTDPSNENWFEAKYHIIYNTIRLGDKPKARKILRLTKILHPELGGKKWKAQFEQLEKKWLPLR